MAERNLVNEMVRYRAKHDLSQAELAAKAGLSTQTINSIETGQQTPSKVTEMKLWIVLEEDFEKDES